MKRAMSMKPEDMMGFCNIMINATVWKVGEIFYVHLFRLGSDLMVTEMKFRHILVKLVTKPLSLLSHRYFKILNQQVDNLISQRIIFLIRHCSPNDCSELFTFFRLEKTIT